MKNENLKTQLCRIQIKKMVLTSLEGSLEVKAELLQLKPHPFICMINFISKKVGNRKN